MRAPLVAAALAVCAGDPDPRAEWLARGEDVLLAAQESLEEGPRAEWPYEGVYRVEGEIPPGYRVGGTSIAARALLELEGWADAPARRAAVERALAFVLDELEHEPLLAQGFAGGYDVRGWGQAYALDFLLRLRALGRVPAEQAARLEARLPALVSALERSEIPATQRSSGGGWNYARSGGAEGGAPSPFMTAALLQALFQAADAGLAVDSGVVQRALDALEAARLEVGSFQYALDERRRAPEGSSAVEGAIGRMPIAEATLLLAGRGDLARVEQALAAFFEHWRFLEERRKQSGTHAKPFGVAPYYFFFAHRYAAQAIELLPDEARSAWRARLDERLAAVRDEDGSWNDRVFERSKAFGTAMVLLALREPALPRPARWAPPAEEER
jgi:hypothetical protein